MQAAGSDNPADYKGKVMDVANAPGEKIYPGELAKGLEILGNGGDIDYVGASAVELIGPGESSGSYRQIVFEGGKMTTVKYRYFHAISLFSPGYGSGCFCERRSKRSYR